MVNDNPSVSLLDHLLLIGLEHNAWHLSVFGFHSTKSSSSNSPDIDGWFSGCIPAL